MMNEFENFSPQSKVWIYQASRILLEAEHNTLHSNLTEFCKVWTAHNLALRATFKIMYNKIVILVVDESKATASGCSIDKSVHFLANFGKQHNVDFFDKLQLQYFEKDTIKTINFHDLSKALKDNLVRSETLFLNSNISTLSAIDSLILPLKNHWLYQRVI
jgi:hypothetical protein